MLQHQCDWQALPKVQHINKRNHHNRCEERLDRTSLLLEDLEAVRENLPTKARLRLTLTSNAHPNHAELRRNAGDQFGAIPMRDWVVKSVPSKRIFARVVLFADGCA